MVILAKKGKCLRTVLATVALLLLAGCAPRPDAPLPYDTAGLVSFAPLTQANLRPFGWEEIGGWSEEDFSESFTVFKSSCKKTLFNDLLFKEVCREIDNATDPRLFFETYFAPFKLYNDDGSDRGTITGYYEPLLNGSRTKSSRYRFPVYKRPKDLLQIKMEGMYPELAEYRLRGRIEGNTVVPYYTRAQIAKLSNLAETVCWVDDDIDLFFLHIQGSGRIRLENGEIINVGYADQNGYKYHSIGKMLIEKGTIQTGQGSLQGMKKFLSENPDIKDEILNYNPSYIFFAENDRKATGSLGVELTPQRSIAVDTRYIPLGCPVFISTKNPATKEAINRLVFAQDRGGAIKGTIRADYFWGFGKEAEDYAGIMKEKGSLWVLLPKSVTERTE
jgi:membrane-bound lytic murein transglycosylase A